MAKTSSYAVRVKIQDLVADLEPDERLPSVRELVQRVGASHTSVFAALKWLESRGFIYSQERRGFYRSGGGTEAEAAPIGILFRFGEFFLEQVPYVQEILSGVKQTAVRKGRNLLFLSYRRDIHVPPLDVREIKSWNLSGLIVIEVEDPAVIGGLRDAAWPVVFVEANVFGYGNSVVNADDAPALAEWCRRAHKAGARRFLMLAPTRMEERDLVVPGAQADQRIAALQAAAAAMGLPPDAVQVLFTDSGHTERALGQIQSALQANDRPVAILTFATITEGAEQMIAGSRPQVTALLTWEGRRPIAARPTFRIRHPYERIGGVAAELLDHLHQLRRDLRHAPRRPAVDDDVTIIQADRHVLAAVPSELLQLKESKKA